MEQVIFGLASVCMDLVIRFYTKDKDTYITEGILDIARLGKNICKTLIDKKSLSRNVDEFCISFTERLENSTFFEGIEEERAEEIIKEVTKDICTYIKTDSMTIEKILGDVDLTETVRKATKDRRTSWAEKEIGVYNNCLRFSVDAVTGFIKKLPEYTDEAIKVLYQRDAEAFEKISEELQMIINLLNSPKNTIEKYREFETDYLRKINVKYKDVNLFGAGLANRNLKKYAISTSYIELFCSNVKDESYDIPIEISTVFDENNYVWLSGEAGGGKTTFVQWLAVKAANQSLDYLKGLIPIVITLRQVNSFPINFNREIGALMGQDCPEGFVEYLFNNDKALLLFDGVDELSKNQREKLYDCIEDLVTEWEANGAKNSKILITSRPYIDDIMRFSYSKYKLMRMNSTQIEQFIYFWYKTILSQMKDEENDSEQSAEKLIEAINKTPSIRAIAGTPLLCAMICTVNYMGHGYMPPNRNELYDRCCQMLITGREQERDIDIKEYEACFKLEYSKKELLFSQIAMKMLEDETAEIKKSKLIQYIKKYITNNSIVENELRNNPELLIDYFVQRTAMLMEPTAGKIDFVHKTFMEYLAGKELARAHKSSLIVDNAIKPFWKEAIIMSFNNMATADSSKIIKKYISLYKSMKCDEYIFMASLCVDNSSVVREDIREDVHKIIKKLIPPRENNIYELAACSSYIVPLLENSKGYTTAERHRCIKLLRTIIADHDSATSDTLEEALIVLMTYFHRGVDFTNKCIIAKTIYETLSSINEKYEFKRRVFKVIRDELIDDKQLMVSVDMLNLIDQTNKKLKFLSPIEDLMIVNKFNTYEFEFSEKMDERYIEWLSAVKSLTIDSSIVSTYNITEYVPNIEKLMLIINNQDDDILDLIRTKKCCKSVRSLSYRSTSIKYVCDRDFDQFLNMTSLSLTLMNRDVEIEFSDWSTWHDLKEVNILVPIQVFYDMERDLENWVEDYPNIKFTVQSYGKGD